MSEYTKRLQRSLKARARKRQVLVGSVVRKYYEALDQRKDLDEDERDILRQDFSEILANLITMDRKYLELKIKIALLEEPEKVVYELGKED